MSIGRPRVEIREFDKSTTIEGLPFFPVGIVGFTKAGPINVPTLVTNKGDFTSQFGDIGWGDGYETLNLMPYAVDFFLDIGNICYPVRGEVAGSKFAYVDILTGTTTAAGATLSSDGLTGLAKHDLSTDELTGMTQDDEGLPWTVANAPSGETALRVFARSKGDWANSGMYVVIYNQGFFSAASGDNYANTKIPLVETKPQGPDEFYLGLYTSAGALAEGYLGSLEFAKKNARGERIFIEDIVNNNSSLISVKASLDLTGTNVPGHALTIASIDYAEFNTCAYSQSNYITVSAVNAVSEGEYNLASATLAQLATSVSALENTNEYELRGVYAPGCTYGNGGSATVAQVKSTCEVRTDSVGIYDFPRDTVTNNVSTRTQAGINSTYMFGYSNWFKYYDSKNDKYIYLPPGIQAIRAIAKTWRDFYPWYAPAGRTRGVLVDTIGLDYKYTDGDLDVLAMNQINPLARLRNEGFVIWGQKATYDVQSDFRDLNIRFLFITIEQAIAEFARALIFEFNDASTRSFAKLQVDAYLTEIQRLGGITEFAVVCDSTNNTEQVVSNNELVIDVFVKASKAAEVIKINFTATRDTVNILRG